MSITSSRHVPPHRPAAVSRQGVQPVAAPSTLLGGVLAVLMAITIAGTLLGGPMLAFFSMAVLAVTLIVLAFSRNFVAAIAVFMAYAAMDGMYRYLSHFSQVVYGVKPLLAGVLLIGWLFGRHPGLGQRSRLPLAGLLGVLFCWGILEAFNPLSAGALAGMLTFGVWYVAPLFLYFLCYRAVRTPQQIETLCYALVGISTVVSLFTVFQYAMGQQWTLTHLPGYNLISQGGWWVTDATGQITDTSWRPASTTATGGGGALWSHMGSLIALGLFLSRRTSRSRKVGLSVCLLANVVGLLASCVRLYVVTGVFEVILLFILLARSPREMVRNFGLLVAVGAIFGLGFSAVQSLSNGMIFRRYADTLANPFAKFQQDRGGTHRAVNLGKFVAQYPFGIGWQRGLEGGLQRADNTGPVVADRESQFNSTADDMGIPGLAILFILMSFCTIQGWRSFSCLTDPHLRMIGVTLWVLLIGYFVSFLSGPSLQGADPFWIFLALLLALPWVGRHAASPGPAQNLAPVVARRLQAD